jgi:hypothetical protein
MIGKPLSCLTLAITFCFSDLQKPVDTASTFLPPRTSFAMVEKFDSATGSPIEKHPAVFDGHFVSAGSNDIVFAYTNASPTTQSHALFMTVLHKLPDGYAKVFEKTYYDRFLWVQDFATVGIQVIKLPGQVTDSVVIATARGASLGAQVEIFTWQDGFGMVNVMPAHPSAHAVSLVRDKEQLSVRLSFEKYPGEKGVPTPMVFNWTGSAFKQNSGGKD